LNLFTYLCTHDESKFGKIAFRVIVCAIVLIVL